MSILDQAVQTQINHIQQKTGKSLDELAALVKNSGLTKHSEIRDMLKRELGLGHGDANALVHEVFQSDGTRAAEGKSESQVLDEIYSDKKSGLRPIHEALMVEIVKLGEFEALPKKGYLSLRRKKQFAMLGPKTNTRVEVGLNVKELPADERLLEQPKGSMCNYIVRLSEASEVDEQLFNWIRQAYENAG
jgi:Domain of unknown function (DUF5655)/Domain of unknown function (DUF4287)